MRLNNVFLITILLVFYSVLCYNKCLLFDQELIFLINMNNKLQQPEMLLIPKEELQRLYRKIREYEELMQHYQEQQKKYLQLLAQTNA